MATTAANTSATRTAGARRRGRQRASMPRRATAPATNQTGDGRNAARSGSARQSDSAFRNPIAPERDPQGEADDTGQDDGRRSAHDGRSRGSSTRRDETEQARMLPYARMSASRGLRVAGLLLLSLGLAVILTYPVAFRLDRVGRLNTGDGRWSIWCVSWVAHALTTNPRGLFDANIFYPHRNTLAYSENNIVAGVLGIPAWLLTHNAFATHNTAMLAAFVLAFLSRLRARASSLGRHVAGHCRRHRLRLLPVRLREDRAHPVDDDVRHSAGAPGDAPARGTAGDRPRRCACRPRSSCRRSRAATTASSPDWWWDWGWSVYGVSRRLWRTPQYWMALSVSAPRSRGRGRAVLPVVCRRPARVRLHPHDRGC